MRTCTYHITEARYHSINNAISEQRVASYKFFSPAQRAFNKMSSAQKPVYLWHDCGGQSEIIGRSDSFFREVKKVID